MLLLKLNLTSSFNCYQQIFENSTTHEYYTGILYKFKGKKYREKIIPYLYIIPTQYYTKYLIEIILFNGIQ